MKKNDHDEHNIIYFCKNDLIISQTKIADETIFSFSANSANPKDRKHFALIDPRDTIVTYTDKLSVQSIKTIIYLQFSKSDQYKDEVSRQVAEKADRIKALEEQQQKESNREAFKAKTLSKWLESSK